LPPVAPAGIPDTNDATLEAARTHYTQGDYRGAVALLRGALAASLDAAPDTRLLGMLAHALANLGDLDAALTSSEQWIAANKLDAAAHYLNAMVLQELGEHSSSRAALQRAVYLLPEFTLAHFALGNNARAEARHAEAQRHFANAAHLLRASATDEPVAESEGLTAGRLREIIAALTAVGAQA
jgi:chemotaxis protein methyltransferase CheR